MTNVIQKSAIEGALIELRDVRARLYVLRSALDHAEIDCASAEVVAGDADNAVQRAVDLLETKSAVSESNNA